MRHTRAMGLSIIDGAKASPVDRTVRVGALCPLCARIYCRAGRLCKPCASRCERQALAEQERAHLAAWLSTRDEDHSLLAERLRAKARALGVDWLLHGPPPAPLHFKDRLEAVITAAIPSVASMTSSTAETEDTGTSQNGRVRGNAGRGGAVKPSKVHPGTPGRRMGAVSLTLADPA